MTTDTPAGGAPERVGDIPVARLLRVIADRVDQGLTPPDIRLRNAYPCDFDLSWHDVPQGDLTEVQPWTDVFHCGTKTDLTRDGHSWTEWHGSLPGGGHSVRLTAFYRPEGGEPR